MNTTESLARLKSTTRITAAAAALVAAMLLMASPSWGQTTDSECESQFHNYAYMLSMKLNVSTFRAETIIVRETSRAIDAMSTAFEKRQFKAHIATCFGWYKRYGLIR